MSSAYIKQSSCCEFMNEKNITLYFVLLGGGNPGGFVLDPSILTIQLLSSLPLTKPTTYIMNGSDDNLEQTQCSLTCNVRNIISIFNFWDDIYVVAKLQTNNYMISSC